MEERRFEAIGAAGNGRGRGRGFRFTEGGSSRTSNSISGVSSTVDRDGIGGKGRGFRGISNSQSVPIEEDNPKSLTLEKLEINSKDQCGKSEEDIAQEPNHVGSEGENVDCSVNCIQLNQSKEADVYQYHVKFDPPLDSNRTKKNALGQILQVIGNGFLFEGHVLYLPYEYENPKFSCKNPNDATQEVTAFLKFVKKVDHPEELCQFYNLLFEKAFLLLGYVEIRQGFFKISDMRQVPQEKLEVWPGVSVKVEYNDGGLMARFDTPSRVLRTETLLDYYHGLHRSNPSNFREMFKDFVIGKIVVCRYNNNCYKVDDVNFESDPLDTFNCRGKLISYKDYMKTRYGLTVTHMEQPMLISRIKPRNEAHPKPRVEPLRLISLVPEFCHLSGISVDHRRNRKLMTEVNSVIKLGPELRRNAIRNVMAEFSRSGAVADLLSNWGLSFKEEPISVVARLIPGPNLQFNAHTEPKLVSSDFTKESGRSCFSPVSIKKFAVFCINHDQAVAGRFLKEYNEVASKLGIPFRSDGGDLVVIGTKQGNTINGSAITTTLAKTLGPGHQYQFVIVILPSYQEDSYTAVKKYCLTTSPIPSQCIHAKSLRYERSMKQTVTQIVHQVNAKLGGAPWGLRLPLMKKTMVIGMDAAHDPSRKNPSVIAFVATMNASCTSYFSRCTFQPIHQEYCTTMRGIFKDALDAFRAHNAGELPERVLFYRDGGSKATFDILRNTEINECLAVIEEEDEYAKAIKKFSYICVAKRIPQRMFLKAGPLVRNPEPGTVLDHTITERDLYDFYIVSQKCVHPTVSPTHYSVIHETVPTKPDVMQKITYVNTFMYFNYSGTIKVPAVIQYAHKLGQLVSRTKTMPNRKMANQLYFL